MQAITTNGTTRLIPDNEPLFLLRGQDKFAAETVRFWADLVAKEAGRSAEIVVTALEQAELMSMWPNKLPDLPASVSYKEYPCSCHAGPADEVPDYCPEHGKVVLEGKPRQRRFKVTITDTPAPFTGAPVLTTTFHCDHLSVSEERGTHTERRLGEGDRIDRITPNGHERFQLKGWSGCGSYESFNGNRDVLTPEPVPCPRSLVDVINQIVVVAPELEEHFSYLRHQAPYTPPENACDLWTLLVQIITAKAMNHPKGAELRKIVNGRP